jgi:hypothetical protein
MKAKLATYRRMHAGDRRILWAAFLRLAITPAGLALTKVIGWRTMLAQITPRRDPVAGSETDVVKFSRRAAAMVGTAANYVVPRPSCLHRSLVLEAILRSYGIAADLRFGTRRIAAGLEAHAWLEWRGHAITPPGDEYHAYAPLTTLRPRAQARS